MNEQSSITVKRKGLLVAISSPSGAGKTTLSRQILEDDASFTMSISVTTRPARPGEVQDQDYHFTDQGTFNKLRDEDAFLEWAKVFDHYYGTLKAPVDAALSAGRDVLFDIDWQGTEQLSQARPDDLVTIFILPPSAHALEQRLRTRAQDSDAVVKRRMAGASNEIKHWDVYDYVIINEDLETSLQSIKSILSAERLKRVRQTGLSGFVEGLLDDL